jgi:hypothetical protein
MLRSVERDDTRSRIYDAAGALLADSHRLCRMNWPRGVRDPNTRADTVTPARFLYRLEHGLRAAAAPVDSWTAAPVDEAASPRSRADTAWRRFSRRGTAALRDVTERPHGPHRASAR